MEEQKSKTFKKTALYYEKQELVFLEYERSLDLEIALTIVPLTEQEKEQLLNDEELAARIIVLDAKNKEELIINLRDLGRSASSEGVRLAAIKELGRTYYPKRFKDDNIVLPLVARTIKYEEV